MSTQHGVLTRHLPLALVTFLLCAGPAMAFSQIESETGESTTREGIISVPLPPIQAPAAQAAPDVAAPAAGERAAPADGGATPPHGPAAGETTPAVPGVTPLPDATAPADVQDGSGDAGDEGGMNVAPDADPEVSEAAPPEILYGEAGLPQPVRDLRQRLIDIARSGDIEKLRPYIETGEDGTVLSLAGLDGDPIAFLKNASGDGDGVEILSILLETLQAGYVHDDAGTDSDIYVWPYFTRVDINALTKPQLVELFELVTAGDWQDMKGFGAYNFYRVGISPDGKLQFFVAGD
ncbi:hypothetical protein [Mangrovibrevibacter kandeliae]|uniref:hypothetical protein n=1 Tax=Mangrovibrevibacter kandeliae TaxID=2968473 RepID=UPI002117F33D|nr:hypothetical protein [Aurantimonas sp. CSK15Z-1]MCQ8781153.1 hypothetical protein [Aurantimonas sp. CSK15Z-1]